MMKLQVQKRLQAPEARRAGTPLPAPPSLGRAFGCAASVRTQTGTSPEDSQGRSRRQKSISGSVQLPAANSVSIKWLAGGPSACQLTPLGCLLKSVGGGYFWLEGPQHLLFPEPSSYPYGLRKSSLLDRTCNLFMVDEAGGAPILTLEGIKITCRAY